VRQRARSFAIVANGFADGPAQALLEYLRARDVDVHAVWHPLNAEEGTGHVVESWAGRRLIARRTVRVPIHAPSSYAFDTFVPLRMPRVDVWFGFNPLACARGLVARRMRHAKTVVLWSVDFVPDRFGRGTLLTRTYDGLDKLCCKHADVRIELTEVASAARNRRHALSGQAAVARVVPMGAWLERVPKVRPENRLGRRVVLLAHLVRRQGADLLPEMLHLLRDDDVVADVIGTGPLEAALRAQAREFGVDDRMTFHGFVADHREVEQLLANASVGVAPYRPGEGTFSAYADPGKLKAYVAAGLPIVLTDVPPSAAELAAEAGGEIVPFDARAFADAIKRLLDSRQEWHRRSTAALAYSQRFDWNALLDGLMEELGLEIAGGGRVASGSAAG
jgi:glycosyltransferase involved in cell wall biosynthesis